MYTVVFKTPERKDTILTDIPPGINILDIALDNAVDITCLCGGNGICKSCTIYIDDGQEYIQQTGNLPEMPGRTVYACQSVLRQAMTGRITIRIN